MGNRKSHGCVVQIQENTCNKRKQPSRNVSSMEESEIIDERPMPTRRQSVAAESYDPEDIDLPHDQVIVPKSDAERRFLQQAVKTVLIFSTLDEDNVARVIDAMFKREVEPGESVIAQGEDGDNFYVIASGHYEIFKEEDGIKQVIGHYDGSGSFGELALMYNTPRAATIVSKTRGVLWALSRDVFRRIVLKNASKKRQMYESLLESVPLLKQLSTYERMNLCDALVTKKFEDGDEIIKQGAVGKEMYFIEQGQVQIVVQEKKKRVEVKRLTKNQYFGELALITQEPRAASVFSIGKTTVAVLCMDSFERLLGPCIHIMKRNVDDYKAELERLFKDPKKKQQVKRKSII